MSISHTASTYIALFYILCAFFLEKGNLATKVRKIVGLLVKFYHFSVIYPQKLTQMFSKSASDDSYKWQICTYFGYCCPFLRRKGEVC